MKAIACLCCFICITITASVFADSQILYGISSNGQLYSIDPSRAPADLGIKERSLVANNSGNYMSLVYKDGFFYAGIQLYPAVTGRYGQIEKFDFNSTHDTLFSTLSYYNPGALAINPSNGKVYISFNQSPTDCDISGYSSGYMSCSLAELNMSTGQIITSSIVRSPFPSTYTRMAGLAFNSSGSLLFISNALASGEGYIDPATGSMSPLCSGNLCWQGAISGGLAIHPVTGTIYTLGFVTSGGVTTNHLYQLTLTSSPYATSVTDLGRISPDTNYTMNALTFGPPQEEFRIIRGSNGKPIVVTF